jgi:hypothetical protein
VSLRANLGALEKRLSLLQYGFLTAFSFMRYVQIKFQCSKKYYNSYQKCIQFSIKGKEKNSGLTIPNMQILNILNWLLTKYFIH